MVNKDLSRNYYPIFIIYSFWTYVFTSQDCFLHRHLLLNYLNWQSLSWLDQPTVSVSEENKFQTVVISVARLFEYLRIFINNAIISLSCHYVNTLLNWWKFVRYDLLGTNFKNIIPPLCYEPTERILVWPSRIPHRIPKFISALGADEFLAMLEDEIRGTQFKKNNLVK